MELIELQAEALAGRQHHVGEQRSAVGIKQVVECTSEPIVAEVLHLLGRDPKHTAGKAVDGLLLAVDRLSFDDDRAQQHTKRTRVRDGTSRIGWDVASERLVQSHALNEMIDEG
jgi:hypothetical protein